VYQAYDLTFLHTLCISCSRQLNIVYVDIYFYLHFDWQMFQLATATHHLIYSGSLILTEARQLTPVFAVLMSDLLLLTRPDPETDSLIVLATPLSLQDIVGSSFHCNHRKFLYRSQSLNVVLMLYRDD